MVNNYEQMLASFHGNEMTAPSEKEAMQLAEFICLYAKYKLLWILM